MDGTQAPASRREFVKSVAFNIKGVGYVPVQLGTVEDVGMGNEAIATRCDRSCHWQGIPCITPNCCTNTCRNNEYNGIRRSSHSDVVESDSTVTIASTWAF